jgi:hypothetical protein
MRHTVNNWNFTKISLAKLIRLNNSIGIRCCSTAINRHRFEGIPFLKINHP